MLIPKPQQIAIKNQRGALYIKKNFPEFYAWLCKTYPGEKKCSAQLYMWERGLSAHPTCPICGKPTPFLDATRGFQRYCSSKCSNSALEVQAKKVRTSLKNWGTMSPSKSDEVKRKIVGTTVSRHGGMGNASKSTKSKQHSTMIEKYGTEHALCNGEIKSRMAQSMNERWGGIGSGSAIIRRKIEKTNQERWGGEPLANEQIREKSKKTIVERYGTESASKTERVRKILSDKMKSNHIRRNGFIDSFEKDGNIYYTVPCPHPECNKCAEKTYCVTASVYYDRQLYKTEPCTHLLPVQQSCVSGTTLELFVRDILDRHKVQYETNILPWNNKELDIYIPGFRLAIECNDAYFHSYPLKPMKYHMDKWKECKKHNIDLIYIWEDQIKHNPQIVESFICSKLGVYQRKIMARKCIVRTIDSKTSNIFLRNNHLQGACKASYRLGLYLGDELVSVMCFGNRKTYQSPSTGWELARFCSLLNTSVAGGASKLFKYFLNEIQPDQVISFSDNDISVGHLYEVLGFQKDKVNRAYWYVHKQTLQRYHRSTFTKTAIQKRWPDSVGIVSIASTESQIMRDHGYFQIYSAGQTRWIYSSVAHSCAQIPAVNRCLPGNIK